MDGGWPSDLVRVARSGSSLEIPEIRFVVEFNDNPIFQNVRDKRREQFDAAVVPLARAAASALAYVEGLPEAYFSGDPVAAKKRFALDIREAVEATGAPQGGPVRARHRQDRRQTIGVAQRQSRHARRREDSQALHH